MSDPIRSRKSASAQNSEAKSGPRPIATLPGEGATLMGGRSTDTSRIKAAGLSVRTREVYRRDWSRFAAWCKANRVQALPCRPETLIRYLDERAAQSPRTVLYRELIVICRTHRVEGERSPRQYPLVRKWLRNYRDDPGLPRASAAPIQAAHLRALSARLSELGNGPALSPSQERRKLAAKRDRALILLGKAAGLRRHDIRRLTFGDVVVSAEGLELTLARSKALGGAMTVQVARSAQQDTCPVRAWSAWAEAAAAEPRAPAFPVLGGGGSRDKAMGPTDICIAIKRAIHAVGIDPTPYTDDSLAAV